MQAIEFVSKAHAMLTMSGKTFLRTYIVVYLYYSDESGKQASVFALC